MSWRRREREKEKKRDDWNGGGERGSDTEHSTSQGACWGGSDNALFTGHNPIVASDRMP